MNIIGHFMGDCRMTSSTFSDDFRSMTWRPLSGKKEGRKLLQK
jgi:hypothetical protein